MTWLEFGDYKAIPPCYERVVITKPFIFRYINGKRYSTSVRQESDGISVPGWLKSLAGGQFRGRALPAAFIHDELCCCGLYGVPVCSWSDAHKIFHKAMLENGVSKWEAWLKYKAVQIGMFFLRWDF